MAEIETDSVGLKANLRAELQSILRCLNSGQCTATTGFENLDGTVLLPILDSHRLVTAFYHNVEDNGCFPQEFKNRLKERYAANKLKTLNQVAELCKIVKALEQASIPAIAIKGPALGQQFYGHYLHRECNDLDILVSPENVDTAYRHLSTMGYSLSEVLWSSPMQKAVYKKYFHHYHLYNPTTRVQLELHWRLRAAIGRNEEPVNTLWNNSETLRIGGVPIQVLPSGENLLYLCIHGGLHHWKRLFWVYDIARIIEKEQHEFLLKTYRKAIEKEAGTYFLEGCYLAHSLFNVQLPQKILTIIHKEKKINKIARLSIERMNAVSSPPLNPLSSLKDFKSSVVRLVNFYRSAYLLSGFKGLTTALKGFLVNPAYWRIYSFSDRFFFLNYLAAPAFWAYSILKKKK